MSDTEGVESLENKQRWIVDVRDVADAILMAYEKPEAEGRYISTAHPIMTDELVEKLRRIYPNYRYPNRYNSVPGVYENNGNILFFYLVLD